MWVEFVKALVIALIQTAVFIAMIVWRALSLSRVRVMKLKTYVVSEKGDLLEVVPPQNHLNLPELESRLMAEVRKELTKCGSPLNLSKTLIAVFALVLFTVLLVFT